MVGIGEPGEILIKGPQVMKGYWKKPKETANAIDENGWFHSGDVAIFDYEGYLKLVDRTKDMITVGRFTVFSNKLENVLAEHLVIQMVATVGVPNQDQPGSEFVKAYISISFDFSHDQEKPEILKQELIDWIRN